MIQRSGQVVTDCSITYNKRLSSHSSLLLSPKAHRFIRMNTTSITVSKSGGFQHKTFNYSASEYARDENRDGFCKIHSNTIEGSWSLLRSWLRPHRGISQDKLPLYLSFFEFVHNVKKTQKTLVGCVVSSLVP